MSKIDRYGKWSDIQDLTTHEDRCCLGSLSLQNIWSIREELDLQHRVGTVIFGKNPCVTNKSKYFWYSDRSFIWSKSMLKSPVIITWELLFETFEMIGASSWQNCLIVSLLLLWRGGLYRFPIMTFSGRDSPVTSMNNPSHSFEFVCTLLIRYEKESARKIMRPEWALQLWPWLINWWPGILYIATSWLADSQVSWRQIASILMLFSFNSDNMASNASYLLLILCIFKLRTEKSPLCFDNIGIKLSVSIYGEHVNDFTSLLGSSQKVRNRSFKSMSSLRRSVPFALRLLLFVLSIIISCKHVYADIKAYTQEYQNI